MAEIVTELHCPRNCAGNGVCKNGQEIILPCKDPLVCYGVYGAKGSVHTAEPLVCQEINVVDFNRCFFIKIKKLWYGHVKYSIRNVVSNIVIIMYGVKWVITYWGGHFIRYINA